MTQFTYKVSQKQFDQIGVSSNISHPPFQKCSQVCTLFSVFLQGIHLQNTEFEVIHKTTKHYLISIFLTPSC